MTRAAAAEGHLNWKTLAILVGIIATVVGAAWKLSDQIERKADASDITLWREAILDLQVRLRNVEKELHTQTEILRRVESAVVK